MEIDMNAITYRPLGFDECKKIREIDASQYIKRAWREINGTRQLVEINYHDPDFPNGYKNHLESLREIINCGGIALGSFDNEKLTGFCSVVSRTFGTEYKYALLDQLFISKKYRGNGIGKKLFYLSANEAKLRGADKFYICAGLAEETIAFYFSLGCEEAKELNKELYEKDTRDYQLEYSFHYCNL